MGKIDKTVENIKPNKIDYCNDQCNKENFEEKVLILDEELHKKDKNVDIGLKITYGVIIGLVLIGWEIFVIYFSFTIIMCTEYKMSDGVFITLLTTTTAHILVLPSIVLNYLFPKNKK